MHTTPDKHVESSFRHVPADPAPGSFDEEDLAASERDPGVDSRRLQLLLGRGIGPLPGTRIRWLETVLVALTLAPLFAFQSEVVFFEGRGCGTTHDFRQAVTTRRSNLAFGSVYIITSLVSEILSLIVVVNLPSFFSLSEKVTLL